MNLREWINIRNGSATAAVNSIYLVPDNIDLTLHADVARFHFDNLDMQNVVADLKISDQTVHLLHVNSNGLDGEINLNGIYSTLENKRIRISL